MLLKLGFSFAFVLLILSPCLGQSSKSEEWVYPDGISVQYGLSHIGIEDQYISKSIYDGSPTNMAIFWSRFSDNRGYRIGLTNNFSKSVHNHGVNAEYEQTSFLLDYFYPFMTFSLFGRDARILGGPSLELLDYYIKHSFTSTARTESEGKLHSLGINLQLFWEALNWLQPELTIRSSVIAFSHKSYDYRRYPDSDSEGKIVPFYNSINWYSGCGIRLFPIRKLSLKIEYTFQYVRLKEWDSYQSASRILSVMANYRLSSRKNGR